mmetsp:Transcript_10405/g.24271  ORF Transcript_10405/g.24271 Transcript_10405/m.24271 type:complete len:222 (+) Transcript_10405:163-828(+)
MSLPPQQRFTFLSGRCPRSRQRCRMSPGSRRRPRRRSGRKGAAGTPRARARGRTPTPAVRSLIEAHPFTPEAHPPTLEAHPPSSAGAPHPLSPAGQRQGHHTRARSPIPSLIYYLPLPILTQQRLLWREEPGAPTPSCPPSCDSNPHGACLRTRLLLQGLWQEAGAGAWTALRTRPRTASGVRGRGAMTQQACRGGGRSQSRRRLSSCRARSTTFLPRWIA